MSNRIARLLPVWGGWVGGYDWYVDGDIASSGDGKSLAGAFKTIAELSGNWAAGQSVWIEPKDDGSVYRESVILPGAGCSVLSSGEYNSGTKAWSGGAKLSGADIAANASFSKTVGRTNVYEIAVTVEAGATQFVNVFEDDVYLTRVADVATCDSTAGSVTVTDETGSIMIYVHASDSSDVTANGKVYEYTKRRRGIFTEYNNCTVSGVYAEKALGDSGSISIKGSGATVTNVQAEKGGNHTFNFDPRGITITGAVVRNGYSGTRTGSLVNYNADVFDGEAGTWTGGWVGHSSASVPGYTLIIAFNGHNNISGALGGLNLDTVTWENISYAVRGFNHLSALTLTDNVWTNIKFGSIVPSLEGVPAGGCTLTIDGGTFATNVANSVICTVNDTGTTVVIDGLTATQTATTDANGWISITAAATVTVQNCAFKATTTGNRIPILCNNAGANLTLNSNTYNTGTIGWTYHYYFHTDASGMTWASDNNSFELTTDNWYIFGTSYTDFATYQAAVAPNDANSTST